MATRRLSESHDMVFGNGRADYLVEETEVRQNVLTRLYTLAGEWMLNTEEGIPYLTDFPTKPLTVSVIETAIKKTILDTVGVTTVTGFSLNIDPNTRGIYVQATVGTLYSNLDIETQL